MIEEPESKVMRIDPHAYAIIEKVKAGMKKKGINAPTVSGAIRELWEYYDE